MTLIVFIIALIVTGIYFGKIYEEVILGKDVSVISVFCLFVADIFLWTVLAYMLFKTRS